MRSKQRMDRNTAETVQGEPGGTGQGKLCNASYRLFFKSSSVNDAAWHNFNPNMCLHAVQGCICEKNKEKG